MKSSKLILFEGIPGWGKTTTSQLLYTYLIDAGINATLYIEGSEHPVDLPFYAYLTKSEYEDVLIRFTQQKVWLQTNAIIEKDYVLIPYKVPEPKPYNDELMYYLSSKEFCYTDQPVVPFHNYKNVFFRRFEQFAARMSHSDHVTILESVLFQHQIHDINRLYPHVTEDEIVEYVLELAAILTPLNPVLFYLSQDSVEQALKETALIRSKPSWSSSEKIHYYIYRKNVELKAVHGLPFQSEIVDNTDRDWIMMFNAIKYKLDVVGIMQSH